MSKSAQKAYDEANKRAEALEPTPLTNVHPADELSAVREEIKLLQERESELREVLLAADADLKGDQYTAKIIPGVRETLDRKAITEAFGEAAIAPFVKATHFKTVKLTEN
jgi:Toprim domain